jgi:TonB family protein
VGRQLSTASQLHNAGVPPTGRLEILVNRSGRVESVRLETPKNGYHDRMIVSAVKAWRYRPALRNGKPVRYFMVVSISLPDL